MATSYSSFFASGLLAPPVSIYTRKDYHGVNFMDDDEMVDAFPTKAARGLSPAAPSSPMAVPGDCDTEAEFASTRGSYGHDRATTPTPLSRSRALSNASTLSTDSEGMMLSSHDLDDSSTPNFITNMIVSAGADVATICDVGSTLNQSASSRSPSQPPNARRLRRRRSSLAGAVSPKSAIKSPSRSVGRALELQKHLMGSPLRSRSSSVSLAAAVTDMMTGGVVGGNIVIPEQNKFIGRLRSGSISNLKRKPLRRVSMQPPAPPPTAPLPALPPSLADTPNCGFLGPPARTMSMPVTLSATTSAQKSVVCPKMEDLPSAPGLFRKNRDRSYSINTYDRIDEEMKEN